MGRKTKESKKGSMKDKVGGWAKSQKKRGGVPYHNPKLSFPTWRPNGKEDSKGVLLDFLQYKVTTGKHPDNELGAEKDALWFRYPFKVHQNVGSKNMPVVCLESFGEKCPICEERSKLYQEGADKSDTTPLWPKDRSLFIVVPLNQEGRKKEPHIWDVSDKLFTDFFKDELEENEEYYDFADLDGGRTLKCRFKAKSLETSNFAECTKVEFVKRKKEYGEAILEKVPNLDDVLIHYSYKEVNAKFQEIEEDKDEPLEDATPKKKNNKKKDKDKKKKKTPECPFGMEFGVDTDSKKKCKKCEIHKECKKAKG